VLSRRVVEHVKTQNRTAIGIEEMTQTVSCDFDTLCTDRVFRNAMIEVSISPCFESETR
jgi:hypothetical protein